MSDIHIVWDWNGTLLNDLELVVSSVSSSISRHGLGAIDADGYRDHFTRPVRNFYDALFGRPVDDMEWSDLNKTFHDLYYEAVDDAELASGAVDALRTARTLGWSQSLLSMSTESRLVPTVEAHGIDEFFRLISGLKHPTGDVKSTYLKEHLRQLQVLPGSAVVIGDTPDDHDAAVSVGSKSILYDGGSHHRDVLDDVGAPVVDSLADAIWMIERGVL